MGKRKNAQNGGAESKVADKSNKNEKLDLWFRFKSFESTKNLISFL